jgi:hypothetical protein
VRKDFQQALAELRTDLDAFTEDESNGLMACGYQMASKAFDPKLGGVQGLGEARTPAQWPFSTMLDEITSTKGATARRSKLLGDLRAGSKLKL